MIPSPAEEELQAPLNNLPRRPVRVFAGREAELGLLAQALATCGETVVTQAVYGLGGVGKSELALKYADLHSADYRLRWWIAATDSSQISAGLAALAEKLCPPGQMIGAIQDAADWALSWLQAHPGWLLILDDVDDPADVEVLLGPLSAGHVVLTSRRDLDWRRIAEPVQLGVLNQAAAVRILTVRTGYGGAAAVEAVARIAAQLGYLPLALDQAAAYIAQQHIAPADYLDSLREHPARMYATVGGGEAQRTIARLWDISIGAISSRSRTAARLLLVLAHYAPEEIPRMMLGAGDLREDIDEALGLLASYSMITRTTSDISALTRVFL